MNRTMLEYMHTHLYEFPVLLVYINGLVDGMVLTQLLTNVQENNGKMKIDENEIIEHYFPYLFDYSV